MKSVYTTDEILQQICKWFVDYYRRDPRNYFSYLVSVHLTTTLYLSADKSVYSIPIYILWNHYKES